MKNISTRSSESDTRRFDDDSGVCNSSKATNSIDSLSDQDGSDDEGRGVSFDYYPPQIKIRSGCGLSLDYDEAHEVKLDHSSQDVNSPRSDISEDIEMTTFNSREIVDEDDDEFNFRRDTVSYQDEFNTSGESEDENSFRHKYYNMGYRPLNKDVPTFQPTFESLGSSSLRGSDVDRDINFSSLKEGTSQYSHYSSYQNPQFSSDRVKIEKNSYKRDKQEPPFGRGAEQFDKVASSIGPSISQVPSDEVKNIPEGRKLAPLQSEDPKRKKKKKKGGKDDVPVGTDGNGTPVKHHGLNPPQYKQMRESPSSLGDTVATQQFESYGTFPLGHLTQYCYGTNKEVENDYGTKAFMRRRKKQESMQQQKKSEDIEHYMGDKSLEEVLNFIYVKHNYSNKKARKNKNVSGEIPHKTQKSNEKNKDKKQKSPVPSSSVEDFEEKGSNSAQPALAGDDTQGGEDSIENFSGKADVYILECGDEDRFYSSSVKVAKSPHKQSDKNDMSKHENYVYNDKLAKGTICKKSVKEKELSATNNKTVIVTESGGMESNKRKSDKLAKPPKVDKSEMPETKSDHEPLQLGVTLINNATVKQTNVIQVQKEDGFQVVRKKKKKVVSPNHFVSNNVNRNTDRNYDEKHHSAFPALTRGKSRQSVHEDRRNYTCDVSIPSGLKFKVDSDLESEMSLPATQGSQAVDNIVSPRLSYAMLAAGPKVPNNGPTRFCGPVHNIQETYLSSNINLAEAATFSKNDSRKSQEDSCIFDGRLILLDRNQIDYLEASLDKEPIGQGGIGTVYRCDNLEVFGIPVAVKKIKTKGDPSIESQVRREKIASRLMNPFILPLLAVVEKSNKEFWFISPYCKNGDLHDAIKRGKGQNNTDKININSQATRVKILLQIALAIQYIHTPVQNVRGPILHKDIASKNVVLDKYLNARLIDFGLAREKDDKSTIHGGRRTYDHPDIGYGKSAKECYDYHSFGVIIREMLTSLGPEGEKGYFLMKMKKCHIEQNLDNNVWKSKKVIQKLNDLSYNCLKCPWTIKNFKTNVIDELRNILETEFVQDIFENKRESNCHQCIINPIAEKSSLTEHYDNCCKKIRVCMACEKNNFLNPVICYCGARLTSLIGSKWGALLVAGDDESQEKADAMKNEILELERVVTSLAPRIMGISKDKVKTVVPGVTEESPIWPTIKKHIEKFSEDEEINTLLIYFSCHGGSFADKSMFELGKKSEYISLDDFQNELNKLHKIDRLIIFLDRCFPPKLTFEKRKFVQINACSEDAKAVLNEEGSMFTKYVIQGLKARSENKECSKNCKHCYFYWSSRNKYVSICSLYDYVNKHLELKAPNPDWKLESFWENIAFFTDDVVQLEFTSKDREKSIHLALGYLKSIDEVKQRILLAFEVDTKTHTVTIQKDTFRNDQQAGDECTTLEQVMEAWVQRFPLSVRFYKKERT